MPAKSKPNELTITRIYDAPVKMVWAAWADPKQAANWWGPRGFTITTHSKDLRPGGSWSYTMHGPDGTDYENTTKYHEVVEHSRLVYDHGGHKDRPPLFRVTVNFSEYGGGTKMEMTMALPTAEAALETKKFIKKAGGNATWDRLAEYLTEQSTGKDQFVINRSFEAPVDVVFDMWTDPKHVSQWLAPTGFTMEFKRATIREGASSFYYMSNGQGAELYGRAEYIQISKPKLLVYTQQFCDQNENIIRHPMAPIWPETMLTKVTFCEEGEGQTRVTVEWEPHGSTSYEEREAFRKERGGMTSGWSGSFDKLEEYLLRKF